MGQVISLRKRHREWHPRALEFFAGIGLARAGLENAGIETIWANDLDADKQEMYGVQWGLDHFVLRDVWDLSPNDIPTADLAWSSSPCTDLSLAGMRHGLREGRESSAFFGFVKVLRGLGARRPEVVVLENVVGLASSHGGDDLRAAIKEFNELGYSVDGVTLDARRWLPQSRPRLFLLGSRHPVDDCEDDTALRPDWLAWIHTEHGLRTHMTPLPDEIPELRSGGFNALVERLPADDSRWWSEARTAAMVDSMSPVQRQRLMTLISGRHSIARTAYRRTRKGTATWEMRSDDIAGCLRTARGGSSRQAVVVAGHNRVRARWMTGEEYAQLMGAGWYQTKGMRDAQVRYGFGDAVAVPAVEWVARNMVLPALRRVRPEETMANE